MTSTWQVWAVLSALFAALTAIFAKIGVENINSDFATLIRTAVIFVVLSGILFTIGGAQSLGSISGRTYLFLILSGLATGASIASSVSWKVPKWCPSASGAPQSCMIRTASSGLTCCSRMNQRGSYEPIGMIASANGP
jgi:hypothetical protein